MRHRKKDYFSILVLIIMSISLGYALLSQNLSITGLTKIKNAKWNVYFDNLEVDSTSVELSPGDSAATIDESTKTNISYAITFNEPGDIYKFTVDVVNDGTIDAMIDSINTTFNNNPISSLPSYFNFKITYGDGTELERGHILPSKSTEEYVVILEYKKDINPEDLPTEPQTMNINLGVEYIQKSDSGTIRNRLYVYTANNELNNLSNQNIFNSPRVLLKRSTTDMLIRHKLNNNTIEQSDIGYKKDDIIHYFKGAYTMSAFEYNKNLAYSLIGEQYCTEYKTENCGNGSVDSSTGNYCTHYFECRNDQFYIKNYAPSFTYSTSMGDSVCYENIYLGREMCQDYILVTDSHDSGTCYILYGLVDNEAYCSNMPEIINPPDPEEYYYEEE